MENLEKEKLDYKGKVYKHFVDVWHEFQYADKSDLQLQLDILEEIQEYIYFAMKNPACFDCSEMQLKIVCDHFYNNVVFYHEHRIDEFENPPGMRIKQTLKKLGKKYSKAV